MIHNLAPFALVVLIVLATGSILGAVEWLRFGVLPRAQRAWRRWQRRRVRAWLRVGAPDPSVVPNRKFYLASWNKTIAERYRSAP